MQRGRPSVLRKSERRTWKKQWSAAHGFATCSPPDGKLMGPVRQPIIVQGRERNKKRPGIRCRFPRPLKSNLLQFCDGWSRCENGGDRALQCSRRDWSRPTRLVRHLRRNVELRSGIPAFRVSIIHRGSYPIRGFSARSSRSLSAVRVRIHESRWLTERNPGHRPHGRPAFQLRTRPLKSRLSESRWSMVES